MDLVFADPPFNIGYLYHGYQDERSVDDYLNFSRDWMKAVKRALKPTGSFFLAIGDEFAADLAVIARRELGFNLRNWIIWHYTFGQQPKMKFARSHTHILYLTMDEHAFTFNPDAVRVASARQTTYKDVRANPKGKLPDDTWFLRPQEANAADEQLFSNESDTWNVSRVCGTFKEREGWHGCQMPIGVLDRVIKAASNPGDVVLDPFNGSGTTCVSAALLGRRYVGIDQSAEYVAYAQKRLEHALSAEAGRRAGPHRGGDRPRPGVEGDDRDRQLRPPPRRPAAGEVGVRLVLWSCGGRRRRGRVQGYGNRNGITYEFSLTVRTPRPKWCGAAVCKPENQISRPA